MPIYFPILIFIFLIPIGTTLADANIPLINSEWVQFALWKLEANGLTGPMFANSRPLEREEVAQIIDDMKRRIENGSLHPNAYELKLINKLEAEFARDLDAKGLGLRGSVTSEAQYLYHDGKGSREMSSLSPWGSAIFYPSSDLTLYEEIDIGRGRTTKGDEGNTASMRTNTWKWDYTADFQQAYISFRQGRFEIVLGRQPLFWGPGYGGSLIISDNSPAFDMMLLKARFGSVKAMAFSAFLDKMWSKRGDPPYRYLANRYLSGHRIDWLVSKRVEVGLSEVVLYGGDVRNIEMQYINPILPFYASQWNSNFDDNILVCAEFAVKPVNKLKLYFQFLLDDFNYTDHDPNALGYIAGFYMSDPLKISQTDLRAEYTRIDTWTYTHLIPENQFTHYGWVIGHHLGPDADQLFLELSRMLGLDSLLKMNYTYKREGVRTVKDRFRGEDYKRMKFPSGPITQQHTVGLQFLCEPLRGTQVNVSWQSFFIHKQGYDAPPTGELNIKIGFFPVIEW